MQGVHQPVFRDGATCGHECLSRNLTAEGVNG